MITRWPTWWMLVDVVHVGGGGLLYLVRGRGMGVAA